MTLEEVYKQKQISVRSLNACKHSKIFTVEELQDYLREYNSFFGLRNSGEKTNRELKSICLKYENNYFKNNQNALLKEKNHLENLIYNLTKIQSEVISSFIKLNTLELSTRSRNAISGYLDNNFKLINFAEELLLSKDFKIDRIKNIGVKCVLELKSYLSRIKQYIYDISAVKDENHLFTMKNKFFVEQKFSNITIPSEIIETGSIFRLIDFLLSQNTLFKVRESYTVKLALKIYKNQKELTLDDIAKKVNLTRERVRQIRVKSLEDLFDTLQFIKNFSDDLLQNYNVDVNANQIEIDSEIIDLINLKNLTCLSQEFITYILYIFLSNDFSLIGNIEDVMLPKKINARKRHNWNNFFLIKKEIINEIDFIALVNDIDSRINERILESYTFSFKSYLSKFLTNNNIEILDVVFPIAENIINEEFGLYLDLDESIMFSRNTIKLAHEYSFEALEKLGRPSNVREIFEKVKELYPNYNTEEAQIRVSMRRKNGFVPIGRKSMFGLKKWEKELDNFKGGTIRNIVEVYLSQFTEPKHISDIAKHVLKYRPKSNQHSILSNLQQDKSGLYLFFKDSYIGISLKKYNNEHLKLASIDKSERKSWEERYEKLKNFTIHEKRLPYSSGVPKEEIKLYRWFKVQKYKIKEAKLNSTKTSKINNISKNFQGINRKGNEYTEEKYNDLLSFVANHQRLPINSRNGEGKLYQFYYKQRKLFDKDKLEAKEELQFIEVAKLLQNIKYENKRN